VAVPDCDTCPQRIEIDGMRVCRFAGVPGNDERYLKGTCANPWTRCWACHRLVIYAPARLPEGAATRRRFPLRLPHDEDGCLHFHTCAARRTCRRCGAAIVVHPWPSTGRPHPFNMDGTSHFDTCPQADAFRRRPRSSTTKARRAQRGAVRA